MDVTSPQVIRYCRVVLKFDSSLRGSVINARVRRVTEGNVFTLSTISGGGGVPCPRSVRGIPHSGLNGGGGGGTPARSGWWGGTPARSGWWGEPRPGLDGGGYPSQVWMVGVPWSGLDGGGTQGTPLARSGWWGVPQPGLDGGGYHSQVWMVGRYPRYPPP